MSRKVGGEDFGAGCSTTLPSFLESPKSSSFPRLSPPPPSVHPLMHAQCIICVAMTVETLCLGNTFSGWLEDSLPTSAPLWALADASQASRGHRASENCEGHAGCLMNIWLLIRHLWPTPVIPVVITVICSWSSLAASPDDVLESPWWVRNITVSVMARLKGNSTLCSPGELPLHWQICWGMISFVWQSKYDISKMG